MVRYIDFISHNKGSMKNKNADELISRVFKEAFECPDDFIMKKIMSSGRYIIDSVGAIDRQALIYWCLHPSNNYIKNHLYIINKYREYEEEKNKEKLVAFSDISDDINNLAGVYPCINYIGDIYKMVQAGERVSSLECMIWREMLSDLKEYEVYYKSFNNLSPEDSLTRVAVVYREKMEKRAKYFWTNFKKGRLPWYPEYCKKNNRAEEKAFEVTEFGINMKRLLIWNDEFRSLFGKRDEEVYKFGKISDILVNDFMTITLKNSFSIEDEYMFEKMTGYATAINLQKLLTSVLYGLPWTNIQEVIISEIDQIIQILLNCKNVYIRNELLNILIENKIYTINIENASSLESVISVIRTFKNDIDSIINELNNVYEGIMKKLLGYDLRINVDRDFAKDRKICYCLNHREIEDVQIISVNDKVENRRVCELHPNTYSAGKEFNYGDEKLYKHIQHHIISKSLKTV